MSVFYLPPPDDVTGNGNLAADAIIEIGNLRVAWNAQRAVVGRRPRGDIVFDLHCKARLPVLVNGEEVGRIPRGSRSRPPRGLVVNRHAECLRVQAVERVLADEVHTRTFSLTSREQHYSRKTSPVFGLRWSEVDHMVEEGISKLGINREITVVSAEHCK